MKFQNVSVLKDGRKRTLPPVYDTQFEAEEAAGRVLEADKGRTLECVETRYVDCEAEKA